MMLEIEFLNRGPCPDRFEMARNKYQKRFIFIFCEIFVIHTRKLWKRIFDVLN